MTPTQRSRISGFTLAELVVVMLLIGVLAVVSIPRLFDRGTFDSRGFSDQTQAALRYAQKAAIAQRRTVCVAFTASSLTLTMARDVGSSTCNINLAGPTGTSPFQVSARPGITYTAAPTSFRFNSLGQPSLGQSLQVTGVSGTITVEAETGYVHP